MSRAIIDQLAVSSKARLPLPTLLGGNDFLLARLKHRNYLQRNADRDRKTEGKAGNKTGLLRIVRKELGVLISSIQPQK
jgi:hypothetical protein